MNNLDINPEVSPLYIGAGFLKYKNQLLQIAPEESLAAIIGGSFSDSECFGNDENGRKNVMYWDEVNKAFYNSVGLKNPGRLAASEYLPDCLKAIKDTGKLTIISVVALPGEDVVTVLPMMSQWALDMGADAVEIDASCKNVNSEVLCENLDLLGGVDQAVRKQIGETSVYGFKVSNLNKQMI